jgi:hypothetical protein
MRLWCFVAIFVFYYVVLVLAFQQSALERGCAPECGFDWLGW